MQPADKTSSGGSGMAVALAILLILFLLVVPFVPLMLAFAEHMMFGTSHVEDALRAMGIHDDLGVLYEPIIEFFEDIFG